jgi:hypothetical protein
MNLTEFFGIMVSTIYRIGAPTQKKVTRVPTTYQPQGSADLSPLPATIILQGNVQKGHGAYLVCHKGSVNFFAVKILIRMKKYTVSPYLLFWAILGAFSEAYSPNTGNKAKIATLIHPTGELKKHNFVLIFKPKIAKNFPKNALAKK